jgi:hypothetical protein
VPVASAGAILVLMPGTRPSLTYAEYLAAEARSDHKHWFFQEEAHTMPGRTLEHAALAAAVIAELESAVRSRPHGRPYRVFTSRVRVRVVRCELDVGAIYGDPRGLA